MYSTITWCEWCCLVYSCLPPPSCRSPVQHQNDPSFHPRRLWRRAQRWWLRNGNGGFAAARTHVTPPHLAFERESDKLKCCLITCVAWCLSPHAQGGGGGGGGGYDPTGMGMYNMAQQMYNQGAPYGGGAAGYGVPQHQQQQPSHAQHQGGGQPMTVCNVRPPSAMQAAMQAAMLLCMLPCTLRPIPLSLSFSHSEALFFSLSPHTRVFRCKYLCRTTWWGVSLGGVDRPSTRSDR